MTRRSPVPPSPAFEVTARGARFRDHIAIVVKAPPAAIFQALYEVKLRDMKVPGCLISFATCRRGWLAESALPTRAERS